MKKSSSPLDATDEVDKQSTAIQQPVLENDGRFRAMIDTLPAALYTTDAHGRLTHFNQACVEFSGRIPELGTDQWCVSWKLFRPDGAPLPHELCPMAVALRDRRVIRGQEAIAERPDGTRIWFEAYPTPLFDAQGTLVGGVNMLVDISQRKRAEALLLAQKDAFEMAASGLSLLIVLGHLVRSVEKQSQERNMVAIHLLDESGKHFTHAVAPSLPVAYRQATEGMDVNSASGPCCAAVCGRRRVVVPDIASSEEFTFFASFALPLGMRAACSMPIFSSTGKVLGTVASYSLDPHGSQWQDSFLGDIVTRTAAVIIERRQDEEVIRRAKDFQAAVLANMGEGLYTIDADGIATSMNPAAERLLGWTFDELRGKNMHNAIHRIGLDSMPSPDGECANTQISTRGGTDAPHEDVFIRKDGSALEVELSSSPIYEGADFAGTVIVFRDIGERKRAQEEKARLAAIVESSNDAIIGKDLNGVITNWNDAAVGLFGYTAEEAVGWPVTMLIPEESLDEEPGILGRIRRGERIRNYETVRRRKDGVLLNISLTVSPIFDKDGKVSGASKIARDITERKQIERALIASEERYRSLMRLMPAALYTCEGPSGIITFYNDHAAELWGRSPNLGDRDERFCGSFKLWWPDGCPVPLDLSPMAVALRENREFRNIEIIIERPDGKRIDVRANIDPIHDENSKVIGAINVFHDVTALKEAEEALRIRSEQFETLLNRAPIGVYLLDADLRILQANPVALLAFGDVRGGIIGRDFAEVMSLLWERSHADEIVRIFRHALKTGESYAAPEHAEHRIGRGTVEYYEWRLDRITLADGRFGLVCYFRDISAQVQTRHAIAESEARLRQIADAMPQMVWTARPDGLIDYYNERWYEYTGLPRGEFGQSCWPRILHPDDLQRCEAMYSECIREGRPYQIEYRLRNRYSQEYRWFVGRALPIRNDRGEVERWFGTCTDIHDQKLAQEELRAVGQRKDEFLATLAHELRNPLAPIRNSLQILRMSGVTGAAAERVCSVMERQVAHLVHLVDDLLELSRISRGTIDLKRERIELATVLGQAVEISKPNIENAAHTLKISLPQEPFHLEGDLVRLSQVFANLLNNAAKYTPRGGEITVTAKREDGVAIVSIRDTGVGIPPEMLSRVFDMFAQVDNVLRRSQDGLGIGLNLARTLVAMHDGSIEAKSDGLDSGSEFLVRLPLAESRHPALESAISTERLETPLVPPCRILVVDDNRDSADSMAMLLKLLGADVQTAYDGETALEKCSVYSPSLLLLDLGMPGMSGYEVARRLRRNPAFVDVMLIALTGWGQEEDRHRTREAGFDHHLVKPVELDALKGLLVSVESKGRAGRVA